MDYCFDKVRIFQFNTDIFSHVKFTVSSQNCLICSLQATDCDWTAPLRGGSPTRTPQTPHTCRHVKTHDLDILETAVSQYLAVIWADSLISSETETTLKTEKYKIKQIHKALV